jgi:hypothetical protein
MTAAEMCGADRQCRINYLKRSNRARRHIEQIEQEQRAQETIDRIKQSQMKAYPRLDRPFSVDWRVSRMGALGVAAGYTFGGHVRGELHVARNWFRFNQDLQRQGTTLDINGTQPVTFVMPGVYYFFVDSDFSPYLGANFVYGRGELDVSGGSIQGGDGGSTESVGTEYHAVGLEGGVDLQWHGNGFHTRLGVAYRPKLYHQARLSAGNYSEIGREAIDQWYNQTVKLDIVFLFGWSF